MSAVGWGCPARVEDFEPRRGPLKPASPVSRGRGLPLTALTLTLRPPLLACRLHQSGAPRDRGRLTAGIEHLCRLGLGDPGDHQEGGEQRSREAHLRAPGVTSGRVRCCVRTLPQGRIAHWKPGPSRKREPGAHTRPSDEPFL